MCPLAARAARISLALTGSLKAIAAVELEPSTSPSRDTSRLSRSWEPATSKARIGRQAASTVVALVMTPIVTSFRAIGRFRNHRSTIPIGPILHERRQAQQLRAQGEARALRRRRVDDKSDPAALESELRHAAQLGEPIDVAHGEHRKALEGVDHLAGLTQVQIAQVQQLTRPQEPVD